MRIKSAETLQAEVEDCRAKLATSAQQHGKEIEMKSLELDACKRELANTQKALEMDESELKKDRELLLIDMQVRVGIFEWSAA